MRQIRLLAVMLMALVATAARAETVTIPGPDGVQLKAELMMPSGTPVPPAVVALHGCGGPYKKRNAQWGDALTAAGHIVVFPDSFGSRGLGSQCRERQRVATSGGMRRQDAIDAAKWLAARPGTPPGGIVLMGWSDGGSTVLAAGKLAPDLPAGLLRGLVAFYPGCRAASENPDYQLAAPLLIMIGASDDWTPAAPCEALAKRVGSMLALVTYPDAYHDFDTPTPVRVMKNIPTSRAEGGIVHVGGNPNGRTDALARVPDFIADLPPVP